MGFLFYLIFGYHYTKDEKPVIPVAEKPALVMNFSAETAHMWLQVARDDVRKGKKPSDFVLKQLRFHIAQSGLSTEGMERAEREIAKLAEGELLSLPLETASAK